MTQRGRFDVVAVLKFKVLLHVYLWHSIALSSVLGCWGCCSVPVKLKKVSNMDFCSVASSWFDRRVSVESDRTSAGRRGHRERGVAERLVFFFAFFLYEIQLSLTIHMSRLPLRTFCFTYLNNGNSCSSFYVFNSNSGAS